MKKTLALLFLACAAAFAQGTTGQQTLVTTTAADPTGDCRVQAISVVSSNASNKLFTCNASTGSWIAGPAQGAGTTGTGAVVLQTSPTITTPVISTVTNTGTETLPNTTGGIPVVIACGATTGATANCANTAVGATSQVYFGKATLASNASVITIAPGFTSTSTYYCVANDVTTRANPVQAVPTSATTFTITNTTGASDVIQWMCVGY